MKQCSLRERCIELLPGQYFDDETNLAHNGFRDYDHSIGRYTESDSIGLSGGINTYLYAKADPVVYIDSRGLDNPGMGPYDPPDPRTLGVCQGTWELLQENGAPGRAAPFVCNCVYVCKSCEGQYTGILKMTLGIPVPGEQGSTPNAEPGGKGRRSIPKTPRPMPGDPTGCACIQPKADIPCKSCPK